MIQGYNFACTAEAVAMLYHVLQGPQVKSAKHWSRFLSHCKHQLDYNANFVKETALLNLLQDAQDFEVALLSLNAAQKTVFEQLLAVGGPGDRERGTRDNTTGGKTKWGKV
jgi:hypothetical protein